MNRREAIHRAVVRMLTHRDGMSGVLVDGEIKKGAAPLLLGCTHPIRLWPDDWYKPPVITLLGNEIRIVAIWVREPRRGTFKRLLADIERAGLRPVVVEPIGDVMPALMRRWGWECRHVPYADDLVEEWRPK